MQEKFRFIVLKLVVGSGEQNEENTRKTWNIDFIIIGQNLIGLKKN